MDASVWQGLLFGGLAGLIGGLWKAYDMRGGPEQVATMRMAVLGAVRTVVMVAMLVVAYRYTRADKIWLVVGAAVVFTVVFGVRLKQKLAKNK